MAKEVAKEVEKGNGKKGDGKGSGKGTPRPKAKKMVCFKFRDTGACDKVDCQYLHASPEEFKKLNAMMSAATSGKNTPGGGDNVKAKGKAKSKKKAKAAAAAEAAKEE